MCLGNPVSVYDMVRDKEERRNILHTMSAHTRAGNFQEGYGLVNSTRNRTGDGRIGVGVSPARIPIELSTDTEVIQRRSSRRVRSLVQRKRLNGTERQELLEWMAYRLRDFTLHVRPDSVILLLTVFSIRVISVAQSCTDKCRAVK